MIAWFQCQCTVPSKGLNFIALPVPVDAKEVSAWVRICWVFELFMAHFCFDVHVVDWYIISCTILYFVTYINRSIDWYNPCYYDLGPSLPQVLWWQEAHTLLGVIHILVSWWYECYIRKYLLERKATCMYIACSQNMFLEPQNFW